MNQMNQMNHTDVHNIIDLMAKSIYEKINYFDEIIYDTNERMIKLTFGDYKIMLRPPVGYFDNTGLITDRIILTDMFQNDTDMLVENVVIRFINVNNRSTVINQILELL